MKPGFIFASVKDETRACFHLEKPGFLTPSRGLSKDETWFYVCVCERRNLCLFYLEKPGFLTPSRGLSKDETWFCV